MKYIVFLLGIIFLAGCCATRPEDSIVPPQLLEIYQLPTVPASIYKTDFIIEADMMIKEDGSVGRVNLLTQSGSPQWDSLAVLALAKWHFSPAMLAGKAIRTLIRRKIILKFAEPEYINLAEILCPKKSTADSVYEALKKGEDFGSLAKKCSISKSKNTYGMLGHVNLHRYTLKMQEKLLKLEPGEFTMPIEYGNNYIIFKRLHYSIKN